MCRFVHVYGVVNQSHVKSGRGGALQYRLTVLYTDCYAVVRIRLAAFAQSSSHISFGVAFLFDEEAWNEKVNRQMDFCFCFWRNIALTVVETSKCWINRTTHRNSSTVKPPVIYYREDGGEG